MKWILPLLILCSPVVGQDFAFVVTDRAEFVVTDRQTFPVAVVVAAPSAARSYVVSMFTTDSCGVCRSWEAVELPKLKALGVKVTVTNVTRRNVWKIGSVPEFWITDRVTGEPIQKFNGYTSAAVLSKAASRKIERAVKKIVKATAPLNVNAGTRYRIFDGVRGSSFENRESLIDHLLNTGIHPEQNHTIAQLSAMTNQELDDLHTADHRANGQVRHISGPVQQQQSVELPERWAVWDGQTYDMETFRGCSARGCNMCANLTQKQRRYRALKAAQSSYQPTSLDADIPDHQQPTPADMIDRMLSVMRLSSVDVLADLGCGDGRILIAAAQQFGCRGIGIEIDPAKADEARRRVEDSGLSGRVEIVTGDALDFSPSEHGVTAISAYLFPELLAQLAPKFLEPGVRVVASPFHPVEGLPMTEHDEVWIYRRPL